MKTIRLSDEAKGALRGAERGDGTVGLGAPGSLPPKVYKQANAALEALGFKWNKKARCHVGPPDAVAALDAALDEGGDGIVDVVREEREKFNFFPTVDAVADEMAVLVAPHPPKLPVRVRILEPSAGDGALLLALQKRMSTDGWESSDVQFTAVELNEARHGEALRSLNPTALHFGDFLEWEPERKFDIIVMNPPFSKGRDLAHVHHASTMLEAGGVLVCLTTRGALTPHHKPGKRDLAAEVASRCVTVSSRRGIVAGAETKTESVLTVMVRKIELSDNHGTP